MLTKDVEKYLKKIEELLGLSLDQLNSVEKILFEFGAEQYTKGVNDALGTDSFWENK